MFSTGLFFCIPLWSFVDWPKTCWNDGKGWILPHDTKTLPRSNFFSHGHWGISDRLWLRKFLARRSHIGSVMTEWVNHHELISIHTFENYKLVFLEIKWYEHDYTWRPNGSSKTWLCLPRFCGAGDADQVQLLLLRSVHWISGSEWFAGWPPLWYGGERTRQVAHAWHAGVLAPPT